MPFLSGFQPRMRALYLAVLLASQPQVERIYTPADRRRYNLRFGGNQAPRVLRRSRQRHVQGVTLKSEHVPDPEIVVVVAGIRWEQAAA